MYHYIVYKALGYLSLAVGLCATGLMFRINNMFYAIALSILGFIISVVNIYWNTKYYQDREKWPFGYLGMLFSSLPVLFLLFVIFKFKK
jgi:hypothetical protein